ncbi:MAG: thioredoxin [Bacteroidota bacterium]
MLGKFDSIVNANIPVLIDFHAEWCQPCKMQTPILKDFASQMGDKVKVIKIDVDKNPEIAQRFQIQGVPTIALFKNGNLVWRQSGVVQVQQLMQVVNPHLS